MAAAQCAGVGLPLQSGGWGPSQWALKSRDSGKIGWKGRGFHQAHLVLDLGLGLTGSPGLCPCQASRQDPGYKRSSSKKSESKKGGKPSLAEASESSMSAVEKRSKVDREQEWSTDVEVDDGTSAAVPLPKPPAGFILDEASKVVLMAPPANRLVTIVDPATKRPLECMIRRCFLSSEGEQCLLLLPLDMPLQILKIEEESEGLRELSDAELDEVLPTAAYALAKRRLHLIISGFCLTVRGGFCYTEDDVMDLNTEYGEGLGGSLAEGVEIANFQMKDSEYLMYTPFDPLMFVALKDEETGELTIADDELLDDVAVLDAIDEENEFQALVEEEEAINEALREAK